MEKGKPEREVDTVGQNGHLEDRSRDRLRGRRSKYDIAAMLEELREDFRRGLYPEDEADSGEELSVPRIDVLTFHLGDQHFAFETRSVIEIVKAHHTVPIPGTPPFISGIMNLRGELAPVIDLKKLLRIEETAGDLSEWVIMIRDETANAGVRVDSVGRIIQLPVSLMKPPATVAGIRAELIQGRLKTDDSLLILLSVPSIMSCRELMAP